MFELEKKSTVIQTLPRGLAPHFKPLIALFVGSTPRKRLLFDHFAPPAISTHDSNITRQHPRVQVTGTSAERLASRHDA